MAASITCAHREKCTTSFLALMMPSRGGQEIADSVDIELELGKRHFPRFHVPTEESGEDYLRQLCLKGLNERYAGNEQMRPGGELSEVVIQRLDRELNAINKLGFANYFLIVWGLRRLRAAQ